MTKPPTHTGIIVGCDSRTPDNFKKMIKVRETKLHWDWNGCKFSKRNGMSKGKFPMYQLVLDTITPIVPPTSPT